MTTSKLLMVASVARKLRIEILTLFSVSGRMSEL